MSARYQSIFREGLFDGRVALITGGGTGIGRCIAHELSSLGAHVILVGRRPEPLEQTAQEIRDVGGRVETQPLNIRDEAAVDTTIHALAEAHGHIDLLVNNAGGQFASPAGLIKPKGWRAVVDTNLNGTWFVTQAVFKHTMALTGGSIVNVVADVRNGFPGMAHTGAARAGVINLARSLAVEWASCGVRINSVAPGFVLSSGMKNYPPEILAMALETMVQNPSARLGTEAEVAAAVAFLLSPAAAYITGALLAVDGGSSLQKASLMPMGSHKNLPPWDGFHLKADLPEGLNDTERS